MKKKEYLQMRIQSIPATAEFIKDLKIEENQKAVDFIEHAHSHCRHTKKSNTIHVYSALDEKQIEFIYTIFSTGLVRLNKVNGTQRFYPFVNS